MRLLGVTTAEPKAATLLFSESRGNKFVASLFPLRDSLARLQVLSRRYGEWNEMTKAEMMQKAFATDPDAYADLLSEARVYYIFDDGSVLDANENKTVVLVIRDGKVCGAVFEDG